MIEYNINGGRDWLPTEELEAVEQSGRSTWQEYAMTPGEWPAPTVPVGALMDARPGAVEPGLRPVDPKVLPVRYTPVTPLEMELIKMYPLLSNVTLGGILGRCQETIRNKRRELGIEPFKWWTVGADYDLMTARARMWWHAINFAQ